MKVEMKVEMEMEMEMRMKMEMRMEVEMRVRWNFLKSDKLMGPRALFSFLFLFSRFPLFLSCLVWSSLSSLLCVF